MNELEWPMLGILCDLAWKVQKSHAADREGSFELLHISMTSYIVCLNMNQIWDSLYLCAVVPWGPFKYIIWEVGYFTVNY